MKNLSRSPSINNQQQLSDPGTALFHDASDFCIKSTYGESWTTIVNGLGHIRIWWLYKSALMEWYEQLVLPIDH